MKQITFVMFLVFSVVLGGAAVRTAAAQDANPTVATPDASTTGSATVQGVAAVAHVAEEGLDAARSNDLAGAQHEFAELHEIWEANEDQVRAVDPALYGEIEASLHRVETSLAATPVQNTELVAAFDHLLDEANEGVEHLNGGVKTTTAATGGATVADFQANLATALTAVNARSEGNGKSAVLAVTNLWPSVEGAVAAQSPAAYEAVEAQLSLATAALHTDPVDWAAANQALAAMQTALEPIGAEQTYTMFDSAAIMLREGLEALLVIAALLAVLRRSNNQEKQIWVWGGAALGILLSIAVAFVLQAVFSQVSAGQNRELIEGVTSLVAAVLLIYVSYWLHSKASLHGWQRYINASTTRALARGNLVGLGLLALLAVFREGAETAVFYLGMAPAISSGDLFFGIGIGVVLLAVAAWLMLVAGVRLPVRLFFRVAGFLVFYLGFKFVGTGIHNLQVAGVVGATPIPFLPPIPVLGIYPTWETLIPQLLMIAFAVAMAVRLQAQDRAFGATAAA